MDSDAVIGGEALPQRRRELIAEASPVLLAHLVFKAVEDLVEHVLKITSYRLIFSTRKKTNRTTLVETFFYF